MECYYHPGRESTDKCNICGKNICKECGLEIAGKYYCKECIENIVGLNLNEKTPKTEPAMEERVIEEEVIPETETLIATHEGPVFKDSASLGNEDNPYKIIDDESRIKTASTIPEVKEFSSEPKLFKDTQKVEKLITEEKAFIKMEEPELTSLYEQEKGRTLNEYNISKPAENVPLGSEKEFGEPQTFNIDNSNDSDIIYPDYSYEPPETSARRALEEKYENYLDDLYFDEEVPLSEQLAQDEEEFGSLTETPYVPIEKENIPLNELYPEDFGQNGEYLGDIKEETPVYKEPVRASVMGAGATGGVYATEEVIPPKKETPIPAASGVYSEPSENRIEDNQVRMTFDNDEDLEAEIRRRLTAQEEEKRIKKEQSSPMSFLKKDRRPKVNRDEKIIKEIEKQKNKEPVGAVDIILAIIMIIVILVVLYYLIYLFFLRAYYPTFTDAILGLANPKLLISYIIK